MDSYDPKGGIQPEAKIQRKLIELLKSMNWSVRSTHGSALQYGFPDLFLTHSKFGYRWVDVKVEGRYRITPAQYDYWSELCRNGSGVWILTDSTTAEYNKLFKPYNWHCFIPLSKDPERYRLRLEMDSYVKHYHGKEGNLK